MDEQSVDALAMVRRIRDDDTRQLKGATPDEIIRFHRERADQLHAQFAHDRMAREAGGSDTDELTIDAVAMVRAIRDAHYELLKDATQEERIRFFKEESARFRAEMAELRLAGRQPRD